MTYRRDLNEVTIHDAEACLRSQIIPADRQLRAGDWSARGIPCDGPPAPSVGMMILQGQSRTAKLEEGLAVDIASLKKSSYFGFHRGLNRSRLVGERDPVSRTSDAPHVGMIILQGPSRKATLEEDFSRGLAVDISFYFFPELVWVLERAEWFTTGPCTEFRLTDLRRPRSA